jgi:mannose-6-phosphate isomerase-like protein (cupin superfamily)
MDYRGQATMENKRRRKFHLLDFDALPGVPCPCGTAYRALAEVDEFPGTIHRTIIDGTAQPHYHRRLTETYYILEAAPGALLELDGEQILARAGLCVVIPPGVIHRAVGRMVILNIVIPKFDPADEFFPDSEGKDPPNSR